nr:unnamed protein product [Callosobruchus analis]
MKVHEVCWTTEAPNILKMRQLSCRLYGKHQDCEHYGLAEIKILSNEDQSYKFSKCKKTYVHQKFVFCKEFSLNLINIYNFTKQNAYIGMQRMSTQQRPVA